MKELWSKIRDLTRSITKNSHDYNQKYMKIKFKANGKLSLNKMTGIPSMAIVDRDIFHSQMNVYIKYKKGD